MNIVNGLPPNYESIVKVFPSAKLYGVIFTYGDTVYTGDGPTKLSIPLQEHEAVHIRQQANFASAEDWWDNYLRYKEFRFREELEAHIAEYRAWNIDSNKQRRLALKQIAKRLSSKLYGSMIGFNRAVAMLKNGVLA